MGTDGTIVIDTRIDTTGLTEGLAKATTLSQSFMIGFTLSLKDSFKQVKESFAGLGQSFSSIFGPSLTSLMQNTIIMVDQLNATLQTGDLTVFAEKLSESLAHGLSAIAERTPQFMTTAGEVINAFINGLIFNLPSIITSAASIIQSLIEGILPMLPNILNLGIELINQLFLGIGQMLPTLIPQLVSSIMTLLTQWFSNLPEMAAAGLTFIEQLVQGIVNAIPVFVAALPQLITSFTSYITTMLPQFLETGLSIIKSLLDGIINAFPQIIQFFVTALPQIIQSIASLLPDIVDAVIELIPMIVTALVNAIPQLIIAIPQITTSVVGALIAAIPQLIEAALKLMHALPIGFIKAIPQILEALPQILQNIIESLLNWIPTIMASAGSIGKSVIDGIIGGIKSLLNLLDEVTGGITKPFTDCIRKFLDIGRDFVKGLWEGISKSVDWLKSKISEWCGGILDNIKSFFGIKSPSRVMRDEVGKMLVYGIRDGIDKNSEAAVEEFQTLLKKLKSQRDLDIINEDEYYTELEKLRDAYFKEGTEEWVQYTTEIYNYQQKLQEEQKKTIIDTYQAMVDEADKAISELEKKQENFEKKLQQNDYFFVTHTLKDIDGNEVGKLGELRDFSDEIEKINQYNDAIDKAQARLGDSAQGQAVYEALLDMDMEQGKLFADTLINASDAELQAYLQSYQEYREAIEQASREEFADEWAELESQYGGIYQQLEQTIIDTFGEIPEEFLENGKLSAEQFGDGFLEKLTEVQSKLDSGAMGIKLADETALQQQRSDGQAAGEAFSQGLVQSEQAIQTAGSSLKDKLIEQFGSVPDDFFAIGQDSANSFCEGFMEKLQSAFAAIQNAVTAGMQSMAPSLALAGGFAAGSVSTYHNNYNFYGSGQDSTVSIFKCQ